MSRLAVLLAIVSIALGLPAGAPVGAQQSPIAQDRSVEPVVLTGDAFVGWSAGPDPTFREPQAPVNYDTAEPAVPQSDCYDPDDPDPYRGDRNCYQSSRIPRNPNEGVPTDRLIGYRWDGESFTEIPFQVDERFTRYLSNNASGFAFYSGVDQHTTYAFDREGFRFTEHDPSDPCTAQPKDGITTTTDPVKGLDDNDELAFLHRDAGEMAPVPAELPEGIVDFRAVRVDDPSDPSAEPRYVYVGLAAEDGPRPSFDATNGYMRYVPDADSDQFLYSQSSYSGYGNAPPGPHCDEDGNLVVDENGDPVIAQRRPKDRAWIFTPRYAFRYEGRWLMTELRVTDDAFARTPTDPDVYGPDIIDQWKARAFQQRPGGQTPCCGYEEEVNNWGGSSMLLGERAGPVRVIRETWGADSSTNNVRQEIFYPDEIRFGDWLRVHPIPPADGIYVQWDYNAGAVERYYNPQVPDGVAVDGQNDDVGNFYVHTGPDGVHIRDESEDSPLHDGVTVGDPDDEACDDEYDDLCMFNDIDQPDPTFSGVLGGLQWEEIAGPNGSVVTRWTIKEHTPGGSPQGLSAQPYYRDDSCFDDGTGSNPGPHLRSRRPDNGDFATWTHPETGEVFDRECWRGQELTGDPEWDRRYWQGSIGTHGLHLNIIAESDNANMTVPLTEIVSEQRMVVLPGDPGNVGESYGRHVEYPLNAKVLPGA